MASWCIEVCPFVILRDFVPPASLPFLSPSDGLFSFSLFSFPGFFLSNVEENGFFCIVVLNIVFLFMRQLDCKLHATIDWKEKKKTKPCQSLPSVSSTRRSTALTSTSPPPTLVNVFFC
ncbi:unnamed protein product [Rangifer tarandus platyrhynchus]|uniref:Uncharacterized protein n=1 Tax=Rangifer tarandus platyrhynchus TaxID=3082113 RepID=A0AC60A673_RANTA